MHGWHPRRVVRVAVILAALTLPSATATAESIPRLFTDRLSAPIGIALDGDGNVWVASDDVTSALLTALASGGEVLGRIPYGDITSLDDGPALESDPETGLSGS